MDSLCRANVIWPSKLSAEIKRGTETQPLSTEAWPQWKRERGQSTGVERVECGVSSRPILAFNLKLKLCKDDRRRRRGH